MGLYSSETTRRLVSPDIMSPIYPDRPIRPLPKRRLRERLSPDAVQSIQFPPAPTNTAPPLFYLPFTEDVKITRPVVSHIPSEHERAVEKSRRNYISRRQPEDANSDEDELAYRGGPRRNSDTTTGRAYRFVEKPETTRRPPQPPGSTTSSADGYDSFENTNNKKKRKIPTPGDSGMNGSHLSNDLASMGISPNSNDIHVDDGGGSGSYYSSPISTSTSGLSGPGRGRYGRLRNGRSPLRSLPDTTSNWSNGRSSKQRQPQWSTNDETTGIISNAIANAEKLPITSSQGQENVSILQQQASRPASSQFTFTCDSQVPGTVSWPKPETPPHAMMHQSPAAQKFTTQATQTSPGINGIRDHRPKQATSQLAPASSSKTNSSPAATEKKPRRRTARQYKDAAAQRREQQRYQNRIHPPAREDIWICDFCEYEDIFGQPPLALMRQYEIKDRKEKRKAEEKKRLLEKAKMKGRKGKKGSKNAKNNAATTNSARQNQQPAAQPPPVSQSRSHSQGTQSEECYEDEYDDEYPATEDPPPTLSPDLPHDSPIEEDVEPAPNEPDDHEDNRSPELD